MKSSLAGRAGASRFEHGLDARPPGGRLAGAGPYRWATPPARAGTGGKASPCPAFSRETSKILSPSSCCTHTLICITSDCCRSLCMVVTIVSPAQTVSSTANISPVIYAHVRAISEADKTRLEMQDLLRMPSIPSSTVIGKTEDRSDITHTPPSTLRVARGRQLQKTHQTKGLATPCRSRPRIAGWSPNAVGRGLGSV